MRCKAAIESAPKGSLTSEAKRKLRLAPFTSKLLFDGQIGAIYKENVTKNHKFLVKKRPLPIRLSLTRLLLLLLLPESLRLNLARIRLKS